MPRICHCGCTLLFVVLASNSQASIVLENFESGSLPGGWAVTGAVGTSWKVGGTVQIFGPLYLVSPQGSFFARSGDPNVSENDTGVLTSQEFTVTHSTFEWLSAGWSGSGPTSSGESYFQILDQGLNPVGGNIATAQSDGHPSWKTESIDLLALGFTPGSKFRFRAVDGRTSNGHGWFAFDDLRLTGDELEVGVVPEATSFLIWALVGLTFVAGSSHRR